MRTRRADGGTCAHTVQILRGPAAIDANPVKQAALRNEKGWNFRTTMSDAYQSRVVAHMLVAAGVRTMFPDYARGALPEDNEGLIDHVRAIDGVVVAAFFEELPAGKVRVSLRSKDTRVDVSKICGFFGGGGHPAAAGARVAGTLDEVRERVLAAIDASLRAAAE